jgi:hypothetical protein
MASALNRPSPRRFDVLFGARGLGLTTLLFPAPPFFLFRLSPHLSRFTLHVHRVRSSHVI